MIPNIFSPEFITLFIESAGYVGLFTVVFAESGLFIGFFLPGDSLLFVAGFLASQGFLNIYLLVPLLFISAVLGDNFGYAFGKRVGPRIFKKENSLLFRKSNLEKADTFYKKYGAKTLILARFMPIVRTFAPILAGVAKMEYRKFFFYNIIGGALWTLLLTLLGYFLGQIIPDPDRYILPIVLAIIVISFLPSVYHLIKYKLSNKK